jgi:uncharacterized protein YkwD
MSLWSILVDVVIIAFIAFGGWRGWRDGLLAASVNLLGLGASLWIAFSFYPLASQWVIAIWSLPVGLAHLLAFFLLTVISDSLVSIAVLLLAHRMHIAWGEQSWWQIAGIVPGVVTSLVTAGYLASLVLAVPLENPLKIAVHQSFLAPKLANTVNRLGAPVNKLVEPALNDLSQLFTIEPNSKELVTLPFKVALPELCSQAENDMLGLVNTERTRRGIRALTMNEPLRQVGRAHALDMFQRGYFSHYTPEGKDPFDRMNAANISYQMAGENLALAPTLTAAHTGLMNSPGHKRNILDPNFAKVGIGCYQSAQYGMMFAQEFTNRN